MAPTSLCGFGCDLVMTICIPARSRNPRLDGQSMQGFLPFLHYPIWTFFPQDIFRQHRVLILCLFFPGFMWLFIMSLDHMLPTVKQGANPTMHTYVRTTSDTTWPTAASKCGDTTHSSSDTTICRNVCLKKSIRIGPGPCQVMIILPKMLQW